MPIYDYECPKCHVSTERYVRLVDFDREANNQRCDDCGTVMRKLVTVPVLAGLDSGPEGFMRGRVENDGCCDSFVRKRVERNLGRKLGNGFFVPGLCPPKEQFSAKAVCYSRQEVIDKARKLGVGVRGPGINVEPRISDAELAARENEGDYTPSPQAMKVTIADAVRQRGGKVTRKELREITEALQEKHGQKKPKTVRKIDRIYAEPE